MSEGSDTTILDLIQHIPLDQVPSAIVLLAARLLTENQTAPHKPSNRSTHEELKTLLKAGELAERLNLPESWVRNEERLGRLPSIRAGRYVRFNLCEVEKALAEREPLSLKPRSFSGS
jgi:hypothetical protein